MFGRKSVTLVEFSVDNRPVITDMAPACELHENKLKKDELKKRFQENIVSTSTIDQIIERHPMLDKMVEVLLKYLYNWLMVVDSSFK